MLSLNAATEVSNAEDLSLAIEQIDDQLQQAAIAADDYIKMDYTLEKPEDRLLKVNEILNNTPEIKLNSQYLERLTDYLVQTADKQERKQKIILTDNRLKTVNKREISYEGLAAQLENGEDGIHNLISDSKNYLFQPKDTITEKDIAEIPDLQQVKDAIDFLKKQLTTARGKRAFQLKKQLIELQQSQYIIKSAYKRPINCVNVVRTFSSFDLDEKITVDENGEVFADGTLTLLNPTHVSLLLCNYSKLKEDTYDKFNSDAHWILQDLERLADIALAEFPLYQDLVTDKIDGKQNQEIQEHLNDIYGIKYSVEYISSLWRNKIPKLIATEAKREWLVWHYTFEEKGQWKKCSCCKQIKLAHPEFFSRNNTSKDGYYSLCKVCRNKRTKEKKKGAT